MYLIISWSWVAALHEFILFGETNTNLVFFAALAWGLSKLPTEEVILQKKMAKKIISQYVDGGSQRTFEGVGERLFLTLHSVWLQDQLTPILYHPVFSNMFPSSAWNHYLESVGLNLTCRVTNQVLGHTPWFWWPNMTDNTKSKCCNTRPWSYYLHSAV